VSLTETNEKRTLCEVLREINDICNELLRNTPQHCECNKANYEEIQIKLAEAEKMAGRMAKKLYSYNKDFDKGWWEENKDWAQDIIRRKSE